MYARWYRRSRKIGGEVRSDKRLTVAFKNPDGGEHRLSGFTDEAVTTEFCRNLDRLIGCRASGVSLDAQLIGWVERLDKDVRAALATAGVLDAARAEGARALADQVADFEAALTSKGGTSCHAAGTADRVRAVIAGCGFGTWTDISPSRVQGILAEQRAKAPASRKGIKRKRSAAPGIPPGIGLQTLNYYLQSFKQFCRWAVREGRVTDNPVAHLSGLNARTDRRIERRALTADECRRLLAAAENGAPVLRMSGPDRAMLYRVALETGLRWKELRSLTAGSFALDAGAPTVTIRAAYSKHRREDVLPLRPETAAALREYLARRLPGGPAFPMPASDGGGAQIMRADLAATGGNGLEPIRYKDAAGHVADFHALRHTFITALCNGGVHPKMAQTLARHSTITLTMDRYTHLSVARQADALDALPDLSAPATDAEAALKTGTDDVQPGSGMDRKWTSQGSETGRFRPLLAADGGSEAERADEVKSPKALKNQAIPADNARAGDEGRNPTRKLSVRCGDVNARGIRSFDLCRAGQ